jgi:hypothetical protein
MTDGRLRWGRDQVRQYGKRCRGWDMGPKTPWCITRSRTTLTRERPLTKAHEANELGVLYALRTPHVSTYRVLAEEETEYSLSVQSQGG